MNKIFILLVILAVGVFVYIDSTACNPPGSAAEKINWAGHNCPR